MNPADGELDPRFSSPDAVPTPWSTAREQLSTAMTYWLATVRPDGRPHVTTIAASWLDDAIHFTTSAFERKGKNLAANPKVVVTTGCNGWDGLDIVIEGEAAAVTDADRLSRLAEAFTEKYEDFFQFRFVDGRFEAAGSAEGQLVFEVRPTKAFGFAKGESFSQTRWQWRA
jgi:pyridoxine/pyridoxamine 5'-phosphate oxidase